jgi:hypothetical protein
LKILWFISQFVEMESEGKTVPTLEERIAKLEDNITGYETLFKKAIAEGNEKDKDLYGDLISKRADNLGKLLAERQLLLLQQQEERHLQQAQQQNQSK